VVGVPLVLENIASPVVIPGAEMSEPEFLAELARRTGCGLLLDVANLYAGVLNHGYDAAAYFEALPADAVVQLHVAGGEWIERVYVDSHARAVSDAVWELVERACARFPVKAIVIERDERLPRFEALLGEVERAHAAGVRHGRWA
jgi:hypothetical protein